MQAVMVLVAATENPDSPENPAVKTTIAIFVDFVYCRGEALAVFLRQVLQAGEGAFQASAIQADYLGNPQRMEVAADKAADLH
jgi:hypothetical protein